MRLPDGSTARSRALTAAVRLATGRVLTDLTESRTVHAKDGGRYTTVARGLTVEVLSGTTRHATVTITRVRD
jgi:hypothetical protein